MGASLLEISAWALWGAAAAALLALLATTALERKSGATRRAALIGVPLLVLLAAALSLDEPGRPWVAALVLVVALSLALTLALRWGASRPLAVPGPLVRIDERDAIFHRFLRLQPGSADFEAYYRSHPERREIDRRIRALPGLCAPGSRSWDPQTALFAPAIFEILEKITSDADWGPPERSAAPISASPSEFTRRVKGFARFLGADLVGTTVLNPAWVYSHIGRSPGKWGAPITLAHPHAIAIAVEMRTAMIRCAPAGPAITETAVRYFDAAKIALIVARFIHLLGYAARAHVDGNYRVLCPPVAVDAGLGELGRLGLLISPRFGPRLRLAVVSTSLPLEHDAPISFGVQHFCELCKKCARSCPSGAISMGGKSLCDGVEKWRTDQERCYRFWCVQGTDCSTCIRVCPYSHPATALHQVVRWGIRRNPLARRLALWGDELIYGRHPAPCEHPPPWHEPSSRPLA